MKKIIYLACSVILFSLISFLVHSAIEIGAINLLTADFDKFGLGLSWQTWFAIHAVGTFLLLLGGALAGYFVGQRWWKYIYPNT